MFGNSPVLLVNDKLSGTKLSNYSSGVLKGFALRRVDCTCGTFEPYSPTKITRDHMNGFTFRHNLLCCEYKLFDCFRVVPTGQIEVRDTSELRIYNRACLGTTA